MSELDMKKQSRTDWDRIKAMKDEDIDFSDNPKLGEDFFKEAVFWHGNKQQVTLRIDQDVLAFFKERGKGYQKLINAILRKYMEVKKTSEHSSR